jgi:hypothetical protein
MKTSRRSCGGRWPTSTPWWPTEAESLQRAKVTATRHREPAWGFRDTLELVLTLGMVVLICYGVWRGIKWVQQQDAAHPAPVPTESRAETQPLRLPTPHTLDHRDLFWGPLGTSAH